MPKFMPLGAMALLPLMLLAGEGRAADVAAPPAVSGNWGGAYIGAIGGYAGTAAHWDESAGAGTYDGSINAVSGGVFGGYNFTADRVIISLEGEGSLFAGEADFSNVPGAEDINAQPGWNLAVKGRLGYDAGRFMPYLAAGYSWMWLDTTWDQDDPSQRDVDVNAMHQGVMAGVGTEIAITSNLFGRIEYMHTWLSEQRYSYCSAGCNADIKLSGNAVRIGVGYKFYE